MVMVLVTTIESQLGQCGFSDIMGHFVPGPLWVFSVRILHPQMLPLTSFFLCVSCQTEVLEELLILSMVWGKEN